MPCKVIGKMKGLKGDTGPKGDKGDKGDTGEQGPQGLKGADGADGTTDTPSQVLEKLKTVDGAGTGLDADLLDGYSSEHFALSEDLTSLKDKVDENLGWRVRLARTGHDDSEEALEGSKLQVEGLDKRVYPQVFCDDPSVNLAGIPILMIHIEVGGGVSYMATTTKADGKGYNGSGQLGKAMANGNNACEIAIMKGMRGYRKQYDIKFIEYI